MGIKGEARSEPEAQKHQRHGRTPQLSKIVRLRQDHEEHFELKRRKQEAEDEEEEEYAKPELHSDEEEEEDDEVAELAPLPTKMVEVKPAKGRASVSAEAYGSFNKKENFKGRVIPKSEEQKTKIKEKLLMGFMFKALDEKELETCINAMEIKNVK